MTIVIDDPRRGDRSALEPAVQWLRRGGIVAFPTDTFYGLAVDASSADAVRDLFDVKGRPAAAALPFVAADRAQVEGWCGPLPVLAAQLAERFWPGPLSLVLDAPAGLASGVLGGGTTVAVRVPGARIARLLAEVWGAPLPATSANRSGEPPAASAAALGALAEDARVLVIDAGAAPGGEPSTIVDARGATPALIREGAIAWIRVLRSVQA